MGAMLVHRAHARKSFNQRDRSRLHLEGPDGHKSGCPRSGG